MSHEKHVLASAIVLAAIIVLCIHIFLFPMYNPNPTSRRIKISLYEQALCHDIYSRAIKNKRKNMISCPKYGIVSVVQGGRLGNQIWSYASVWATARRTGLEPYVPRCVLKTLEEYFENLSVPSLSNIGHCIIDYGQIVQSLSEWNSTEQNIIIPKYAFFNIFLVWLDDFRREFTFKKKFRDHAQLMLKESTIGYNFNSPPTYVGVHVRRSEDYVSYLWMSLRVKPASVDYYLRAMRYFDRKYVNVIFLIASDSIDWCKYNLITNYNDDGKKNKKFFKINFVSSSDAKGPGNDLAILSACNHSIIDYGTYGAFGAVLTRGETIVYNVSMHFSTTLAKALPNWKIMT